MIKPNSTLQNLDAKLDIESALLTVILWLFYLGHSFDYSISLFLFIYFSLVIYGHYKYTFTHLGSAACTSILLQNWGGGGKSTFITISNELQKRPLFVYS